MRYTRDVDLRCYPKEDPEFHAAVQHAVANCRNSVRRAETLIAVVEAHLRDRYPLVRIRAREQIANPSTDDGPEVWYCYRDGSFEV